MGSRARPNVFSIPPGIPFARALATGVVARLGSDPLGLADALILVPTRRAARGLREAFGEALGGAALLPTIRALGDADGEDQDFGPALESWDAPPPIAPLRRHLLLAKLVQAWADAKKTPFPFTQALNSAAELARFLDEALTQGLDWDRLNGLAPDAFAEHWNDVASFLGLLSHEWPILLRAEGKSEAVAGRDRRLRALAQALAEKPPAAPVIAAGSTGSIPATAALLKCVAHLPSGAVVLPGLDTDLDEEAWSALDAAHPQFGLAQLLGAIGIAREDVLAWPSLGTTYPTRAARVRFLSEALRPPPTTHAWRALMDGSAQDFAPSLENLALVEAKSPREEALVVACALREALETPGRTAALVTPDRGLARRVAAEMTRWNITIDDSAGVKLSRTPPGLFLSLLARAAAERFAPVPLLALLKHPLTACGITRQAHLGHVRTLEALALRGLRPAAGLGGVAAKLVRADAPVGLQEWFARLTRILDPFAQAILAPQAALDALATAHFAAAEALAASDDATGADRLWRGQAGEAAMTLLAELAGDGNGIDIAPAQVYADSFRELADTRAVRPLYNLHPRLAILGPLEARLLDFDLVVLSSLNEGQWPAEASTDPWLSRPMRAQLGLDAPERRTGLAAHDFATLCASREVVLTRSLKESGAPTIASRWLLRIRQLAKGLRLEHALASKRSLLGHARGLEDGPRIPRAPRPVPRPPVAARPRTLSITEIETWLRDPYAIYARHVLALKPLKPIDQEPGPAERGIAIHSALEHFLKLYPTALPPDALTQLLNLGDEAFARAGATERIMALWRPRFARAAQWFLDYETTRRSAITGSLVEAKGELEVTRDPPFRLRGRADRIDFFANGEASILDYKTGRVPSHKQIEALLSPQLPLEGAMLLARAFGALPVSGLREFIHIQLSGGEPPGREHVARLSEGAGALAEQARARLSKQIARYDSPEQPYPSRAMVFRLGDVGDYDHLARVREWMIAHEGPE